MKYLEIKNSTIIFFQFVAALFLASAVFAAPEADPKADPNFYRPGFGSYGYGSYTPLSLSSFRYANNPVRNVVYQPSRVFDFNTAFGEYLLKLTLTEIATTLINIGS